MRLVKVAGTRRADGRNSLPALAMLAVLAAVHLALNFALTPNTPFPFSPDDFAFLGMGLQDLGWDWKRPVSANIIFVVAAFGPGVSYFVLNASALVVAWMVLLLLRDVFGVAVGVLATLVAGVLLFSHAAAFEHGKYLGLMTNLISHGFGLASLLLLWRGWRNERVVPCLLGAFAYLASVLAKEDFVLPPLLFIGLLWAMDRAGAGAPAGRRPARAGLALLFLAIAVGSLAWHAYDGNPFVAGLFSPATSSRSYAVDLAPGAVLAAMRTLFLGYTPVATALAGLACAGLWIGWPAQRLRLAWFVATVLALAAPYALIPNNMPGYRAYAWLPWMAAIVALALEAWRQRQAAGPAAARAAPVLVAVACAALAASLHHEARMALAARYAAGESVNRRMLELLERHRAELSDQPVIGLHGLDGPSPWCGNGPLYLARKRDFGQRWIVFANAESACYQTPRPGGRKPRYEPGLSVVPPARACAMESLPVLVFEADGSGRLARGRELCAEAGA